MRNRLVFPDGGYSTDNLRALVKHYGLSRKDAAKLLGVPVRSFHNWCLPVDSKGHRDMPLKLWNKLVEKV